MHPDKQDKDFLIGSYYCFGRIQKLSFRISTCYLSFVAQFKPGLGKFLGRGPMSRDGGPNPRITLQIIFFYIKLKGGSGVPGHL